MECLQEHTDVQKKWFFAVTHGDLTYVEHLFNLGWRDIEICHEDGVLVALQYGHDHIAEFLAEHWQKKRLYSRRFVRNEILDDFRFLKFFVEHENLLRGGFQSIKKERLDYALRRAFCSNCGDNRNPYHDPEHIKLLIKIGADINQDNCFAIKLAIENKHYPFFKWLIAQGADIHFESGAIYDLIEEQPNPFKKKALDYLEMINEWERFKANQESERKRISGLYSGYFKTYVSADNMKPCLHIAPLKEEGKQQQMCMETKEEESNE